MPRRRTGSNYQRKRSGEPLGTPRKKKLFLQALMKGASITAAAQEADVSTSTVRKWRNNDVEFAFEWDEAWSSGTDTLEDEAVRRAVKGVRKPVVSAGRLVAYERVYSDRLLEMLLKGRRPERFRDNATIDLNATQALTGAAERLQHRLLSILERSVEPTDKKS